VNKYYGSMLDAKRDADPIEEHDPTQRTQCNKCGAKYIVGTDHRCKEVTDAERKRKASRGKFKDFFTGD
jgi:PHP family Zn ribbon phosphoesterase